MAKEPRESPSGPETDANILETVVSKILETANAQNQALLAELRALREREDKAPEKAEQDAIDRALDPARKRLMEVIRIERDRDDRNGGHFLPEENVDCISACGYTDDAGVLHAATFTANIQNGRVIRLTNYKIPEGCYISKNEGGICPFDRNAMFIPNTTLPSQTLKSWIYHTFNKIDISTYVGKPARAIAGLRKMAQIDAAAE